MMIDFRRHANMEIDSFFSTVEKYIKATGLSVYRGNPKDSFCPFDFGEDFEFNSNGGCDFLVIMNNDDDNVCTVFAEGAFSHSLFSGVPDMCRFAVLHRTTLGFVNEAVNIEFNCQEGMFFLLSDSGTLGISSRVLYSQPGKTRRIVLSRRVFGCIEDDTNEMKFFGKSILPVKFEEFVPAPPHHVIISRSTPDVGVHVINYPETQDTEDTWPYQSLINGEHFLVVGRGPTSNSVLAIQ